MSDDSHHNRINSIAPKAWHTHDRAIRETRSRFSSTSDFSLWLAVTAIILLDVRTAALLNRTPQRHGHRKSKVRTVTTGPETVFTATVVTRAFKPF